jgi:hypothetical protein
MYCLCLQVERVSQPNNQQDAGGKQPDSCLLLVGYLNDSVSTSQKIAIFMNFFCMSFHVYLTIYQLQNTAQDKFRNLK